MKLKEKQYLLQYNSCVGFMESSEKQNSQEICEGRWSQEEHSKFLRGIMEHGKDWKLVEKVVQTRTGSQVRSHAQKFFIKLNKISKERKKGKNRDLIEPSDIELEILRQFDGTAITEKTPSQITRIINKDWALVAESFNEKRKESKFKKINCKVEEVLKGEKREEKQKGEGKEGEQKQNLAGRVEQADSNQQSFFIKIMRKMNKDHFCNGRDFSNLIDFGNTHLHEQSQTRMNRERKRSFGLPDEEEDSVKLKETLEILHRKLGYLHQ